MEDRASYVIKIKLADYMHPVGECFQCYNPTRNLIKIECSLSHSFCASCVFNLIKITRIKKGLVDNLVT